MLPRAAVESPSTLSRVARLAWRRDPNTGRYADPGLSGGQSGEEIDRLLRSAHEKAFAEWLAYSLEQKRTDLELYFAGLDCPKPLVLETWKRLKPYRLFIPAACDPADEQLFLSDLEAMLDVMWNEVHSGDGQAQTALNWRVRALLASIESRSGDVRLTLKVLSQGLRISPHRLGLLFKRETGFAFRDYLRVVRMRRAAELLRDPNLTVVHVSRMVGHNKPSNFVREFHTCFGSTPADYRARRLAVEPEPLVEAAATQATVAYASSA